MLDGFGSPDESLAKSDGVLRSFSMSIGVFTCGMGVSESRLFLSRVVFNFDELRVSGNGDVLFCGRSFGDV